jgi:hypothetical protein
MGIAVVITDEGNRLTGSITGLANRYLAHLAA